MTSDFCVITSYFNPARYKTKRQNFDAFMDGMAKQNVRVRVIELAFGDDEFELDKSPDVLQFRGSDIMWQKERLLNVAVSKLPKSCTKVGWFDADLIFKEPDWLERTSEALEDSMVVQPFSHAVRLNRGNEDDGTGLLYESFASCFVRDRSLARTQAVQPARAYRVRLGRAPGVRDRMRPLRCLPDRQRRSSHGPRFRRSGGEISVHAAHDRTVARLSSAFRPLGSEGERLHRRQARRGSRTNSSPLARRSRRPPIMPS